jgi:hypothetical protein
MAVDASRGVARVPSLEYGPPMVAVSASLASAAAFGPHAEPRTVHELKSWPDLFAAVRSGAKTHDLRRGDDRRFAVGDELLLREWDPRREAYTGATCRVEVTYVTSADVPCALFDDALDPRYCILSVRLLDGPA